MTPRRRRISPGPSWAVLSEPASSSPSVHTSNPDVDMGDDEAEHEPDPIRAPIAKRKAPTDESSARKPHKQPRLDMANGSSSPTRLPSSSFPSSIARAQPAPSSSTQKNFNKPFTPDRPGARGRSTSSGTSTSDFSASLSQRVQGIVPRDKGKEKEKEGEKEKEKEKTRERGVGVPVRRVLQKTARKHTVQVKRPGNVNLSNLLRNAQRRSDPSDSSAAWTRIRPRGKPKRTNYNAEMGHVRPLDVARQRDSGDTIELTDSSDTARRPRPSQPSSSSGPRPSVSANRDDPIIISDDDDLVLAIPASQRRRSGPGGTQAREANRKGAALPVDVEVISISDSDEELAESGPASTRPTASNAPASASRNLLPPLSQRTPPVPAPAPVSTPAPVTPASASAQLPEPSPSRRQDARRDAPPSSKVPPPPLSQRAPVAATTPAPITPASTSTQLHDRPPSRSRESQRPDGELPPPPRSPSSYGPPPDDFDDAFGNMDFDMTGDDANPSDALDGWDRLDVDSSFATLPAPGPAVATGADEGRSASVSEGAEDELLFDSYVNMDQLEGDADNETCGAVPPGGDGDEAEDGAAENGVANGQDASTRETPEPEDGQIVDGDQIGDRDTRMQSLEDGEVRSNDSNALRPRHRGTPEDGEIRSQESAMESRKESQSPSRLSPAKPGPLTSTLGQPPSSGSASPHSSTSVKGAERPRTLAIPDISSYNGVRFIRTLPQARENPFFSRALNGAVQSAKAPASEGIWVGNEQGEGSGTGTASAPVEVRSNDDEVQNQDGDTDMQDDAAVPIPVPPTTSDAAVPPTPSPEPQVEQPAAAPTVPVTPVTSSTMQALTSAVESLTTANDNPPPSTQPNLDSAQSTTSSTPATPCQPPAATQPLVRSFSRPFIAPPRVPRPGAPMSLVEALNDLRRQKLRAREEERELARRRSTIGVATERSMPSQNANASQSAKDAPTPMPTATSSLAPPATPVPAPSTSASQSGRTIGKTPSLNDLRTLLRRNVGASSSAPTETPTRSPMSTSNDVGEDHVPVEPVAVPSPSPAPVTTQAPTSTDKDEHADGESYVPIAMPAPAPVTTHAPASMTSEPVATPAAPAAPPPTPASTSKDGPLFWEQRMHGSAAWSTPTPTPTTASVSETTSSSAHAKRRRAYMFVPFEAFISPVQAKSVDKGKGKAVDVGHTSDPFVVPAGSRRSTHKDKDKRGWRASWHARRESAAFEAYIVRDSPRGPGASGPQPQPVESLSQSPRRPRFSEAAATTSPVAPDAISDSAVVPEPETGGDGEREGDGRADDVDAIEVGMEVDEQAVVVDTRDGVDVGSTHADNGEGEDAGDGGGGDGDGDGVDEDEGAGGDKDKGEGETEARVETEAMADEADALLELASVHLSQPENVAVVEVRESPQHEAEEGGKMDVTGESVGVLEAEVAETPVVDEPEREARSAMVVDSPTQELEPRADEGETVPRTQLDDELSPLNQTEGVEPQLPDEDVVASVSEDKVASTSAVTLKDDIVQDLLVVPTSHTTTPDLILPEDPFVEPLSASRDAEQNLACDNTHRRDPSGGTDSVDECDALLRASGEGELEPEVVPVDSLVSSRTISSTSLAPPRVRSRLSRIGSKRRPVSRATSSADPLDLLHLDARVPNQTQEASTSRSGPEYMGGYPVVTWASYVAEQREYPPVYKLARDLPHSLQDHMSILPASFRNSDVGRRIFEACIQEAMANEPEAPLIEVFDNDIDDEVTPKWEFHYTNEMWYAEGVPPPDLKNLQSCGCVGRCDPKSNKCACARRQREWVQPYIRDEIIPPTWPGSSFVYDHKGILQRFECPIFECNQFCNCDDDCPNRVVQNGRKWPVHIVRTKHKGWGVSAGSKKIPKGSYLGIYAGELLTEQEGEERGRLYDLYGRTYLFSVDFHHLKFEMEDPDEWDNLYVVDAYHAGNFTRFLNHSCDPNCKIFACYIDDADVGKPLLAIFTTRDVEPWEELCFSYYGDIDEKREEIEQAKEAGGGRELAVYAQCRCEADNCLGRLFS